MEPSGVTVSSCGDTTSSGTGCFLISNPFGSTVDTRIHRASQRDRTYSNTNDSDYSLSRLQVTPVPEPASMLLIGLLGVGGRRFRTRRSNGV